QAKKPLSALEIGLDLLIQLLDRNGAALDLAIDKKGWGRVHPELLGGPLTHLFDAIEHLLIRQTLLESLLGEAGLLGNGLERIERPLDQPVPLLVEQGLDHGEILVLVVLAGTAGEHEGAGRERVEGELAQDEAHLAGIDVALLQLREGLVVEV